MVADLQKLAEDPTQDLEALHALVFCFYGISVAIGTGSRQISSPPPPPPARRHVLEVCAPGRWAGRGVKARVLRGKSCDGLSRFQPTGRVR